MMLPPIAKECRHVMPGLMKKLVLESLCPLAKLAF